MPGPDLCALCNTKHWPREPHKFPDAKPSVYQKGVASEVKTATETSTPVAGEMISVPKAEWDRLIAARDKQRIRVRKAVSKSRAKNHD